MRSKRCLCLAQRYNLNILIGSTARYDRTCPRSWPSLLLAAIGLLLDVSPGVAQQTMSGPRIKALIVDGFSNHDWRKTTAFIASTLTETGMFAVDVTTTPEEPDDPGWVRWRPKFSDYAVVILNWNNVRHPEIRWPRPVEHAVESYVQGRGRSARLSFREQCILTLARIRPHDRTWLA